MRKKISKRKLILLWALSSLAYKCVKMTNEPFDSELCGSRLPADYDSPHIQTCQQFLIKDLTISDSHCDLKFT